MTVAGTSSGYFVRAGEDFVPQQVARGPWGDTLSGHAVGGILASAVEQACSDSSLRPCRLTIDLLRPAAMSSVRLLNRIVRQGKRITVIDAELVQDGKLMARAGAMFLRHGVSPEGGVWTAPATAMPEIPDPDSSHGRLEPSFAMWAYALDAGPAQPGNPNVVWANDRARKFVWIRETHPPVEGMPLTPFLRAVLAADVTSGLTHWSTRGLSYINVDYTVALTRLPDGEFVGLASEDHQDDDGIAGGAATMFDRHGPIGKSFAMALAQPITLS